ncbi:MAG: thioredoxin [Alphaproteobacteria bacterium]|nr:thioredoxin [Alphaproteobacteria bacterium]
MTSVVVTDSNFETEVLKADLPVVVDFWAEWCGPCKTLTPVVEEVAEELVGKVKVVKVNIDDAPETPSKYGIRGVPTLIVFKEGKIIDTRVGGMPKNQLVEWIKSAIQT